MIPFLLRLIERIERNQLKFFLGAFLLVALLTCKGK